jgi:mono/diheme cytochrome c family protein/small nuclear ribonucleoprotein (snRNP)-like protein
VKISLFFSIVIAAAWLAAQTPQTSQAPASSASRPAPRRGFAAAFPQRPPGDPAAIARGKALYGVNCNFCHGSDARGGEGGPNLLRSELVLNDQHGELIANVVQNGKGEMPKLNLTKEQISDIAAYIHSFPVGGYDVSRMTPPSILVGDAKAGEADFNSKCASCHSASGDLKGIASRIPDPKTLQNTFLMPGGGGGFRRAGGTPVHVPPTTVTVTLPSGQKVEGPLVRIDDFNVTLRDADGYDRTFRRDGDTPKVEIHDPLHAHRELLPTYTDKQIHDITAYLVTLK